MKIIRQMAEDVGVQPAMTLMGLFKKDAEARIQAIRDFQANGGDVQDLRMQAHSLKGLCRTYGATQSGNLALALQEACDKDDEAAIAATAQDALDSIPGEVEDTIEAMRALAEAESP